MTKRFYDIGRVQQRGLHTVIDLGFDESRILTREDLATLRETRPEMFADVEYNKRPTRRKETPETVSACGAPNDLPTYQEEPDPLTLNA